MPMPVSENTSVYGNLSWILVPVQTEPSRSCCWTSGMPRRLTVPSGPVAFRVSRLPGRTVPTKLKLFVVPWGLKLVFGLGNSNELVEGTGDSHVMFVVADGWLLANTMVMLVVSPLPRSMNWNKVPARKFV